MITNKGKELISRYVAGRGESWAGAIELGVGETAATVNDTSLVYPFTRVPIDYIDFDPTTYVVTARATVPQEVVGVFHEIGVFSEEDFPEGEFGHTTIFNFTDDTTYQVTNGTLTSDNVRLGDQAYKLSAPNGGTAEIRGFAVANDYSSYTGNDVFNLAYFYTNTGGAPSINVRFETTLTDYFLHSFTPTTGYNIETFTRDSVSQVGNPSWASIGSIYFEVTAQADVTLDGIAIEDTINFPTYGMVAREVLSPEIVKASGAEREITFTLTLGF